MEINSLLDLPEISHELATFMRHRDNYFAPFLWKSALIGNCPDGFLDGLSRNRHVIRTLDCRRYSYKLCHPIHLPSLETLHVHFDPPTHEEKDIIIDILRQHPTIRHLKLKCFSWNHHNSGIWTLPQGLQNLSTLRFHGAISVKCCDLDAMRDLLLNLDALHLTRIQLPHYSKPPSGFPKMKNLTLRDLSDTPPLDQLEFILLCPNLRRLCWGATESGVLGETIQTYPIDQFAKALGENTWPELEYLKWPTRGNSDQELASIIGAIPRLTGFTLRRSMISEQAKKELRHHFGWLKELSLHQIRSTDRGFPVEALRYCPQLESFHARVIPINAFVDPEPWPCESSLKVLRIGLHRNTTMEGDLLQYDFIKRLSRLHRLEELSLSCYGRGDSRVGFNMEQGLDQLSTLTRLKTRVKIWSTHPVGTRGRLDGRSLEEPRGRRGAECPPW